MRRQRSSSRPPSRPRSRPVSPPGGRAGDRGFPASAASRRPDNGSCSDPWNSSITPRIWRLRGLERGPRGSRSDPLSPAYRDAGSGRTAKPSRRMACQPAGASVTWCHARKAACLREFSQTPGVHHGLHGQRRPVIGVVDADLPGWEVPDARFGCGSPVVESRRCHALHRLDGGQRCRWHHVRQVFQLFQGTVPPCQATPVLGHPLRMSCGS
jgi:hypothetical protein